ncbi:leucyl/phenylalanyl-tRNA--protein transferase [Bdellovibrio sp. HCB337]|uniref:leucyl/phenylalanyl-tRNA--protein transferase n=1 Tax=Bdellovibrio sp. HCB337 TaxID=3394358 RepID=UPI0039A56487
MVPKRIHFQSSVDFPDPRDAMAEGVLAVGGLLDVGTLYTAYSMGIFPWPHPDYPLLWFSPEKRGIIEFKNIHIPHSFEKFLRQRAGDFEITIDRAFPQVVRECSKQPRPGQQGTWILPGMVKAYIDFHKAGYAHSLEVWHNQQLVGGIYGVFVKGVFSGESMFYKSPNASKLALYQLIQVLKSWGLEWMDIQMVTPVTASFGGSYLSREEFLQKLKTTQEENESSEFPWPC